MPLHPFIEKMLADAAAAGRPSFSAVTPAEARVTMARMRCLLGAAPGIGAVSDLRVPTRDGAVHARLYRTIDAAEVGLLVYFHGGGWVCGALDDFDVLARTLVRDSGCAVLLVDYRLAPEHPYPCGLHDAVDAALWANENVTHLLGQRVPLSVGGDSAGGNLAIAAAAELQGRVAFGMQLLFYPVTDADMDRASYRDHGSGLGLTRQDMQWFFSHYAPPSQWRTPAISVLRRPSLQGTPPTWLATAEFDVLRDEGELYAQRLRDAGVQVELHRVDGMTHGFARLTNLVEPAADAVRSAGAALHRGSSVRASGLRS